MSSYTDVKNLIISNIKANGQREITGPILQDVLLNMLENSSEADAANKEYVDNKIADIPVEKGSGYQSMVQKVEGNTAEGQYSSAFGMETSASGNSANAEGWQTKSNGVASHAEGVQTEANGNASHAEGQKTITLNKAEHTEGTWNLSIKDKTIHTVGIGSNYNDRKNAHEIHLDGKHYIYGIGGYDGTNSQTEGIKTVQEVAEEVVNAVQITYAELKSLRDAGKLVPGQQYRITDYTCTTTQTGTKSAGHQFDIIVTADDESTLNEEARAALHTGDEYFSGCNLSAWKIWYCLDNDTTRFAWADATNGKGVIYRMIDEWNNDAPYDFKNIQFYRKWDSGKSLWSTISSDNTGVPCYTFSSKGNSATISFTDYSLASSNSIYSNVIKKYVSSRKQTLNNICFFGNYCYSNTFGNKCYSNTFGNYCYYNTFGNNCQNNTFGNYCNSNTFGDYCYSNTFGNDCQNNTFGNNCYNNTFGNNYFSNILGNNFQNNTFGNYCSSNTFGNYCYNNTFGNNCYRNTFGNNFQNNTFGNDCNSNTFGNSCQKNTFGNNCSNNTFGNYCRYIKFASDSSSAATKYNYYQNNYFGDGCQYIVFTGAETASNSQQVQNYNFAQGLQGTSSAYLTIDGVRNRAYETYISRDTDGTIKESVIAEFENRLGNCVDLTSEQNITATKTFSAGISLNNTIIRKVKTPTANDDAANKQYVDNKIADIPVEKGSGNNSIIQKGSLNTASSAYSSAFGYNTTASMAYAHAEGYETTASGTHSHVEGYKSTASGQTSHAEGTETKATNDSAHAEGYKTTAARYQSHAEGNQTYAAGVCSHTEGFKTKTTNKGEHAEGLSNISIQGKTVHTVGIGSAEDNVEDRKNAEEIHVNGDKYVFGIGGYDGTNSQTEGIKTVQEVAEEVVNAVQIKYTDLKSLRDTGTLVPGQQYRITDYTCTTTQTNTKSAEHIFDIIVTADDESTLNEVARAVKHYGDTYFANSDLNAWKIWYSLDNDTNRFAWADSTNGKGVIYRMIDEFNNDCPYDFKNIQFARDWSVVAPDSGLAGTIYCYTFSVFLDGFIEDATADDESVKAKECIESDAGGFFGNNVIRTYQNLGVCFLNGIVFVTDWTSFSVNHYSNTFGNDCSSNTFGNDCNNNTFGNSCYYNTFGNYCYRNTFGNDCNNNTFGNKCYCNTFGNSCGSNTFGNDCCYNTFENSCYYNTFGNYCSSNTFGNNCYSNIFGDNCEGNTFGNDCHSIKFASDSSASTKYNYYQYNHFGNGCQYIVFTGAETASSSAQVQNYNFAQGLKGTSSAYLTIDGVRGRSFETYISKDTDGTIKESVIADTATKKYVDTELGRCAKLDEENTFTKNVVIRDDGSNEYPASIYIYPKEGDNFGSAIGALEASFAPGFYMTFRDSEGRPTGLLSFGGGAFNFLVEGGDSARIANIASPTDSTDAANKKYVDDTIKANIATHITYTELKSLRDAGKLVSGTQYRITDYTCTTTQANTKSAGHQFDLIVTADDESTLNEVARAVKHYGDTYFANNDLSAWKIWYCLDNDTTRFAWADETNGKGVIYRMIDEFNNDCPYDFKNIQFRRVDANTVTVIRGQYYNDFSANVESFFNSTKNTIPFKYQYLEWYDSTRAAQEGFADLLGMTEEEVRSSGLFYCILDDKEWYGDPGLLASIASITDDNSKWLFTFNTETFTDSSLDGYTNNVFSNEVGVYLSERTMCLNNICFFGNDCNSNIFGNSCNSNTFGSGCYSNTFGNYCLYNIFGNSCNSNTFGSGCYSNTFVNDCYSNTFGSGCNSNTFGNYCKSNTFGSGCYSNTFGNYCLYNIFGNSCNSNTFGGSCEFNTFGSGCNSNTFGIGCYSNTFGNYCNSNTFGNSCDSNTFGNSCKSIKFATSSSATTKYNYYQKNNFGDGCEYIVLEGKATASSSTQVQNYNFAQGLQGTSSVYLTIDGERNRSYETKVAKNSNGEVKVYCEADLIL